MHKIDEIGVSVRTVRAVHRLPELIPLGRGAASHKVPVSGAVDKEAVRGGRGNAKLFSRSAETPMSSSSWRISRILIT